MLVVSLLVFVGLSIVATCNASEEAQYDATEIYRMITHNCDNASERVIGMQLEYMGVDIYHMYFWEIKSHMMSATHHACVSAKLKEVGDNVDEETFILPDNPDGR